MRPLCPGSPAGPGSLATSLASPFLLLPSPGLTSPPHSFIRGPPLPAPGLDPGPPCLPPDGSYRTRLPICPQTPASSSAPAARPARVLAPHPAQGPLEASSPWQGHAECRPPGLGPQSRVPRGCLGPSAPAQTPARRVPQPRSSLPLLTVTLRVLPVCPQARELSQRLLPPTLLHAALEAQAGAREGLYHVRNRNSRVHLQTWAQVTQLSPHLLLCEGSIPA